MNEESQTVKSQTSSRALTLSRRGMLSSALFGAGAIGLRALATGLPAAMLLDPFGKEALAAPVASKMLILLNSQSGDPIGCNVPGTYGPGKQDIVHPTDPAMAATTMKLGGQSVTAAKPWTTIPQEYLDRMCFFHHTTRTNGHSNHDKVLRLMGAVKRNEMSFSLYAKSLSKALGTIQAEPVGLGGVTVSFEGRTLSRVSPRGLSAVLAPVTSPLGSLQALRDKEINRIYSLYKQHGTAEQKQALDRYAISRAQARQISTNLLDKLSGISNDNEAGQVVAAPVLAAMKVTPVITIKIAFGGDNHADPQLQKEADQQVAGVNYIKTLLQGLKDLNLQDEVIVASLNVFGRNLQKKGLTGRDHNGLHHCAFMIGSTIRPGVVGSVSKQGNDWGADAINSSTGVGGAGGDIKAEESLASLGKTLGTALGVPDTELNTNITEGKVVTSVIKTA
ncbi:MAG: DUF1501 domain-containing protein [Myxococcales bacterium]|nr:DUF1501 domain-containing protein [Myxococcales bacterium]